MSDTTSWNTPEARAKGQAKRNATVGDINRLTARQESFSVYVASGMTYADAAHNAGYRGDWAKSTASHVAQLPHVIARIAELRILATGGKVATIIERKEQLTIIAMEENKTEKGSLSRGGNIEAIKELNKMDNVYVRQPRQEGTRILNINVHDKETKEIMNQMAAGMLREEIEEEEE